MSATDSVRGNKSAFLKTFCGDYSLILNKVDEKNIITHREYRNIKSINKEDKEGHVNALLDKIISKGEGTCQAFLKLLETDEDINSTYPELKNIQMNTSGPGAGAGPGPGPGPAVTPTVPADKQLLSVRTEFIERVSEPNLNTLLGKLLQQGIINDVEKESAENPNRAKKAEALIDMVRKKGPEASSALIAALCEVDPVVSKLLNLQ